MDALEELSKTRPPLNEPDVFALALQKLYEHDVLSDEGILAWGSSSASFRVSLGGACAASGRAGAVRGRLPSPAALREPRGIDASLHENGFFQRCASMRTPAISQGLKSALTAASALQAASCTTTLNCSWRASRRPGAFLYVTDVSKARVFKAR